MSDSLLLSPAEVIAASGGYRQPAKQLEILHKRGFWRAWRSPVTGEVLIEREHYLAVCQAEHRPRKGGDEGFKLLPA